MTETRSDEPMRVPRSKLHRPRLGRSVIDRTWLFQRPVAPLDGGRGGEPTDVPVTVLSAPAGSGKTTLMSTWAKDRAQHGDRVGWVALDDDDNDPVLLWTSLLAAVHAAVTADRGAGDAPAADPGSAPDGGLPMVHLENLVAGVPGPVWLFLDDVQTVRAPEALAAMSALLRGLPDQLHLVLATRRDPVVPLHRLRLAGRLREIRAADLALDRDEVRQVLAHHGVTLAETSLALLVERTEGWAAGVRLAALTLATAADPPSLVRDFAGDDRAVADYLAAEVLASLGTVDRELLRSCAVPEQLTADLAVAVTGDLSAATLLERLYRDNVLVSRLGEPGGWYRVHSLLRGHLVSELRRTDPARLRAVHARTAEWFAAHGDLGWAVSHALATGDDALAVRMVTTHGPRLLADGRARLLHRLIAAGSAAVQADRGVRELATLTALELGSPPPVPLPRTAGAEPVRGDPDEPPAGTGVATLQALVTLQQARRGDLALSGTALVTSAPVTAGRTDDLGLLLRLNRGIVSVMAGELAEAGTELGSAVALAAATGNDHALLQASAGRTVLAASRGDYQGAWDLADQTVRIAARLEAFHSVELAAAIVQAAHSARQRLEPVAARHLAERAQAALAGTPDLAVELTLTALCGTLDVEEGRQPAAAARRIRDCWARAQGQQLPPLLVMYLAYSQHRCSWQVGRPRWAQEALDQLGERVGAGGDLAVLTATEHLALGRGEAARRRLAPVLDGTLPCGYPLALQQAWLTEAVLADQSGQAARSHEALEAALEIAEERTALRAFLDMPGVPSMLDDNVGRFGRRDPLVERIRAAGRTRTGWAHSPLSPKEAQLLGDLPAQLTLEEIAARRQLSVNTVKSHVRAIYSKLGVTSRREAIAVARRRGLL
jgi:LuxR family maltose regulon positive regulatory protein